MTTFESRPFVADNSGGLPERNENVPLSPETPPTYTEEDQGSSDPSGLIAAFVNLRLPTIAPALPTPEHCLAHLKVLHVFHKLKEDVGYSNGLFGLWDANAEVLPGKERDEVLAKIREKRWTLYVARAAERFQDWWINVLCQKENAKRLEWKDMVNANLAFKDFTSRGTIQIWTESDLPPIDVLMVWHSFMLNPRSYLEDCLRFGLCDLWATGMPWSIVNAAVNTDFNYNTSEEAIAAFVGNTNHNWNNRDDSMTKSLLCPRCSQQLDVLWTTCGQTNPSCPDKHSNDPTTGTGYGDKGFSHICHRCGGEVTHDLLRVAKFQRHTEQLVTKDWPLGGTIIDPRTGFPDAPLLTHSRHPNFFPNRLITLELGDPILNIFKKEEQTAPSMDTIKRWIEQAIKQDDVIRKVNKSSVAIMGRPERLAIRKMMSRYWDNSSIFALELGSAVLRQAVFVDKMHDIDWLHSSAAISTMKRLLIKYQRFIAIIASHPNDTAVPTLDIDLAWHTSQLSPRSYFAYTMSKCRKFIDHDDKMGEDALSAAFEWTSKTYEKLYREVYSECTCWYCEAIRSKHISNSGRIFGTSKHEKILNNFYDSGAAKLCPSEGSAHVSSHNAVRVEGKTSIFRSLDRRRQTELDRAYEKACKRADAKGRERPVRDHASYGAWGYQYPIYGPYMAYPVYGGYYAGDPCSIPVGAGMPGSCAAGTCGGGIASGACGGANGSCGMAGSCGGGAGGGGCGGGGGGGGGGGCGGGGGGGCGGGG